MYESSKIMGINICHHHYHICLRIHLFLCFFYELTKGKRTVPEYECYIQFIETNQLITFITAIAAFYVPGK